MIFLLKCYLKTYLKCSNSSSVKFFWTGVYKCALFFYRTAIKYKITVSGKICIISKSSEKKLNLVLVFIPIEVAAKLTKIRKWDWCTKHMENFSITSLIALLF